MISLSNYINESKSVPPGVVGGEENVIQDKKLKDSDTVVVKLNNKNPYIQSRSIHHIHINPEEWQFKMMDSSNAEYFEPASKTFIFKTSEKKEGKTLKARVYGGTEYVQDCTFKTDGPIQLDFKGIGAVNCTFEGPFTIIDMDDIEDNIFKKGAKIV